ncbi:MAG: peptidase C13 family protein, partial [Betaproteobacteria bacterium]|nr:peptidase C13 family protein [Betaproteobacteria bacterium]
EFRPLRLAPIDPPALKQALDESGIKWKIVVVSACYSGGFIDPLKDENAMIITASSANRQSFGCGNESDSTYLARALFDEALRKTRSFEAAFQVARDSIARRERAGGFSPSEPQIFVGAAMREKLKQVERRFQAPVQ